MINKPDEEFVKKGAQDITEKEIETVVEKSEQIKKKFKTRGPLARFREDVGLLIAAVKDYRSGLYRKFPFAIIAAIVFALIYVFNPFDLMPDMLPVIGQLYDVAVMGACLALVEQDLLKYKMWREGQAG
jgi:uncharacterized membrane protein YkvA (DUF1232 family)